eukprot:m.139135 g.139135  ORF g.139135 m.139135 type:complete len:309 (-) comp30038_c0_seq1:336-1262(-)
MYMAMSSAMSSSSTGHAAFIMGAVICLIGFQHADAAIGSIANKETCSLNQSQAISLAEGSSDFIMCIYNYSAPLGFIGFCVNCFETHKEYEVKWRLVSSDCQETDVLKAGNDYIDGMWGGNCGLCTREELVEMDRLRIEFDACTIKYTNTSNLCTICTQKQQNVTAFYKSLDKTCQNAFWMEDSFQHVKSGLSNCTKKPRVDTGAQVLVGTCFAAVLVFYVLAFLFGGDADVKTGMTVAVEYNDSASGWKADDETKPLIQTSRAVPPPPNLRHQNLSQRQSQKRSSVVGTTSDYSYESFGGGQSVADN